MINKPTLSLVLLVGLVLFFEHTAVAQIKESTYPQNYFRSPLSIPLLLSGNFGELRSNHFHAGIDIKTQGVVGQHVLSAADGYVSRIKIQEYGYGKVVYVNHPNGYTTVYAHLKSFNDVITKIVREKQYQTESYTVDMYLDSNQIILKKGERLALSGNSGGSGGAHLHFEIRETESEIPVNPLLFNFPIVDNIPPKVKGVLVYPVGAKSLVNGKRTPLFLKTVKAGKNYKVNVPVKVSGKVGIGLQTNDYLNRSNNRCGVYDILMKVNEEKVYQYRTEKISFGETRYVNAHCDYEYKKKTGTWIHKIYTLPNDKLTLYPLIVSNGVVSTMKDSTYQVKVKLKDVYQNISHFSMVLKGTDPPIVYLKEEDSLVVKTFFFDRENEYSTNSFRVYHAKGSLYDHLEFKYFLTKSSLLLSDIHHVHTHTVPLHKSATMSIKCDKRPAVTDKIVVVRKQGKQKSFLIANYINGWVNFKSRYFGAFYLDLDTVAPSIKSINIFNGKNIASQKTIDFKVTDDKSGVTMYRGKINDEWVLFEYDYKKSKLTYTIDEHVKHGQNTLHLLVGDAVDNKKVYRCNFVY
jgi:murein DD-endopeptidase MepM/ murein hydrolase activator NlpD